MTLTSILTMLLILGFTVGGFIYFLVMAIGKEKRKRAD